MKKKFLIIIFIVGVFVLTFIAVILLLKKEKSSYDLCDDYIEYKDLERWNNNDINIDGFEELKLVTVPFSKEPNISVGKIISPQRDTVKEKIQELIQRNVLRTYVHLSAKVCEGEVEETEQEYLIEYQAIHEYCTSACYKQYYEFNITVNKESEEIFIDVTRRDPEEDMY